MAFTQPDAKMLRLNYLAMQKADRIDTRFLPAYTRTGTAYWFGSRQLLVPYAANRPIKNWDGINQMPLGMFFSSGALTNDLLHGRDLTNAVWEQPGGATTITVTRDVPGADGTANTGNRIQFGNPGIAPKTITAAVAGTGNKIRCTSAAHGLLTDHTLVFSFPTGTVQNPPTPQHRFATAINGTHSIDVLDANTFEVRGTQMDGTFTVSDTVTVIPSMLQSITDATARARVAQFVGKMGYLTNNSALINNVRVTQRYLWTIDGGGTWVPFHANLNRHLWQPHSIFYAPSVGVANQTNPRVGFAADNIITAMPPEIIVDFVQCVQNMSMPVPFFPAAGSPTTLGAGDGTQATAGKLVKKTGTMRVEWFPLTERRDARTTNYTNVIVGKIAVDANNNARIEMDKVGAPPGDVLEPALLFARYKRGGTDQCLIQPATSPSMVRPLRVQTTLFTYGANDARLYDRGNGGTNATTHLQGSDTSVTVWAAENSGSFVFGDFTFVKCVDLWPHQIAT